MHNRLRLVMGATALLYLGPLFAGLGGFGWSVVPVFVAIFLLWTLIMRPQNWPKTAADWKRPEAWVTLVAQLVMQGLLVTACFGIGRGIGGVLGALPQFPLMLPIAVSFLSIPLARMLWDPRKAEAMDRFLDDAMAQVERGPATRDAAEADRIALTARLLAPVQALPDDTPDDTLAHHVRALSPHTDHEAIRDVLSHAAEAGTASRTGLRALVLHATDPAVAEILAGSGYVTRAFKAAGQDDGLLLLFARRCAVLLQEDDQAWWDCPDPDLLRQAALTAGPETQGALIALADLTVALTPPEVTTARIP